MTAGISKTSLAGVFTSAGRDFDQDIFECRGFGLWIEVSRDEFVRLGAVHRRVAGANIVVFAYENVRHLADFAPHRNALIVLQAESAHVFGMEQNHVAAVDAAVEIVIFVHDGIELAFAANRHQAKLIPTARERRERVCEDVGLARSCGEIRCVVRAAGIMNSRLD